jgi:hypothetical protein
MIIPSRQIGKMRPVQENASRKNLKDKKERRPMNDIFAWVCIVFIAVLGGVFYAIDAIEREHKQKQNEWGGL